jgi:hypothetical protein
MNSGEAIGPWTCATGWNGERLDLDFVMLTLRRLLRR